MSSQERAKLIEARRQYEDAFRLLNAQIDAQQKLAITDVAVILAPRPFTKAASGQR